MTLPLNSGKTAGQRKAPPSPTMRTKRTWRSCPKTWLRRKRVCTSAVVHCQCSMTASCYCFHTMPCSRSPAQSVVLTGCFPPTIPSQLRRLQALVRSSTTLPCWQSSLQSVPNSNCCVECECDPGVRHKGHHCITHSIVVSQLCTPAYWLFNDCRCDLNARLPSFQG